MTGAGSWRRSVEGGDGPAEPARDGAPPPAPPAPGVGAGGVERGAPGCVAHAERRVQQHEGLLAGGQQSRAGGIPEQQDQRQYRGAAEDHERHASASAIVNLPSYNALPTQAPASRAARAARRSSSEPTPPETMTSSPSAASAVAPSMSGPVNLPSRETSL